jgi:tRNA modification GTPase
MTLETRDTIAALATPAGPGARAIVRVTGPDTAAVVSTVFSRALLPDRRSRTIAEGDVRLPGVHTALPAAGYYWPAPLTYTGQDLAEVHTLSSPPLVELLVSALLGAGARAARPGEFTMRAFLAGKLDLTRAEAVLGVIEAGDRDELKQALAQLAGGVTRPLQALRDDLLNLLADVEAALDFADEDLTFVGEDEQLKRIGKALAHVTLLGRQVDERSLAARPFRVVLAGRPNAGKSSLFTALVGRPAALVGPQPGTTRDYLVQRLDLGTTSVELVDTAGWRLAGDEIESQANTLGRQQAGRSDLVLLCVAAGQSPSVEERDLLRQERPPVLGVATKCDTGKAAAELMTTSAVSGLGLGLLRAVLAERVAARAEPPLAPSLSRCRHHVEACLAGLRRAHALVLEQMPPELLALELRGALDQLGEMVGVVYTDDLLDRVFSRFCIGK